MNYNDTSNYTIVIQWSEVNNCFVASLPEWGESYHQCGKTYEEALLNARQAIDVLIKSSLSAGRILPEPQNFSISSPIV
jgi:antitoxin HicB